MAGMCCAGQPIILRSIVTSDTVVSREHEAEHYTGATGEDPPLSYGTFRQAPPCESNLDRLIREIAALSGMGEIGHMR